jgi:1-deoxy-D-xylulose-5-phosphate reductoisomerase
MKKKIAILGSTGSIGKSVLNLINNSDFEIIFLTADKNYKRLIKQANKYNVKNLIITNDRSYLKALSINKNKNIRIYNTYSCFNKIIKKKLDYVMASISGINGLKPTYEIIKFTKKIAIANKESLICAWPILLKELNKYKTKFIPVDSEHFSIWSEIKDIDPKRISKIYLTASGGPLLRYKKKSFKDVNLKTILNHPNWSMGKKISVDSATMMNKCLEIIEAKNIFNLNYKKIGFIIHPSSYVHAIIVYNNGISKIIAHDTTMNIPIFNTIYDNNKIYNETSKMNFKKLNNLNFEYVKNGKFPIISFLRKMPNKHSLFETLIISINDTIVKNFLLKKIQFNNISKLFLKLINRKEFVKYKKVYPSNIDQIIMLNNKISKQISKIIL